MKFTKASGIFETDLVAVAMNTTMTSRIFETETVLIPGHMVALAEGISETDLTMAAPPTTLDFERQLPAVGPKKRFNQKKTEAQMEFEGLAGGKRSHTTSYLVTISYQTHTMEFKGHLISSPIISYHVTAKLLGFLLLQLLQLSNNTQTYGLCVN